MKRKAIKIRKQLILVILLAINVNTFGQIRISNGINNTSAANSSAFIDASSNTTYNQSTNIGKGLLFPRTELATFKSFGGTPIGVPTSYPTLYDGFIVYNTTTGGVAGIGATQGILTPGYWYYENKSGTVTGGIWKPFLSSTSTNVNWSLAGNSIVPSNFLGTTNAQPLRFFTNNMEKARITSEGRMGIGTTVPMTTLQIQNIEGGATTTVLRLTSPSGANTDMTASGNSFLIILPQPASLSSSAFTVTRPGSFYDLVMNSNGNWAIGGGVDDTYKLRTWGRIGASGFINTSDIRLKRNIKSFQNGLDVVKQLRPVSYEKKNSITDDVYSHSEIGFIAQEVQKVLPQIINIGNDEQKTLAMDYNSLIPVLTKAIQELNDTVQELNMKIIKLERVKVKHNKNLLK